MRLACWFTRPRISGSSGIARPANGSWIIFAAWPVLATVDGYRQNHLAHHQHANTEKDPDWIVKLGTAAFTFPQKVRHAALQLLGYLVAINSFRDLAQILPRISKNDRSTRLYKLARLGFYLGCAVLFTVLGIWKGVLLYWIVPFFTLFFLFLYVRSVAEHFGSMDYEDELGSTRTVKPVFLGARGSLPRTMSITTSSTTCFPACPSTICLSCTTR